MTEFTREHLTINPAFEVYDTEPNTIVASIETSCELIEKLGLDCRVYEPDCLKLYAYYNVESDELTMMYTYQDDGMIDGDDYYPTSNETNLIVKMIEECCEENHNCSLSEFYNRLF